METENLKKNLDNIRRRIDRAAERSRRNPGDIRLMAVSKTRSREEILAAHSLGLTLFGENRIQEIKEKFFDMPADLELHLIGHLQRNKARSAAEYCGCVQSLDKWETLEALDRAAGQEGKILPVLLEINTSGEEAKDGIREKVQFFEILEKSSQLTSLEIRGLMCMAPFTQDEAAVRKSFRDLRELRDEAVRSYPGLELPVLSMGMSGDFEIAIEEGSTLVRLGTILFGARQ